MKNDIQYVVLQKDYSPYWDKIMGFYKPEYEDTINDETINNSALIGLALADSLYSR
ncbi:hypothetical protein KJ836_01040 [Patescibacteria group bacterium]|nr:hypothetical protein [Patescibacteria group bacterium]